MTFKDPKTWRGRIAPTDLNREVRDQFRALRAAVSALESAGGGGASGILPIGQMIGWAGSTIPTGWLVCDGQTIPKGTYPDLYDILLETYGASSATSFVLPNTTLRFLRGVNSPGDGTYGSLGGTFYANTSETITFSGNATSNNPTDNFGSHSHNINKSHSHNYNHQHNFSWGLNHAHGVNVHSHGINSSGGAVAGSGTLGTNPVHSHGVNDSNNNSMDNANHTHNASSDSSNVTSNVVGGSANSGEPVVTGGGSSADHQHSAVHTHDISHSHVIADRLPEYDDVNWLINYQTDAPEDWFIAGEAILGTSMIGA